MANVSGALPPVQNHGALNQPPKITPGMHLAARVSILAIAVFPVPTIAFCLFGLIPAIATGVLAVAGAILLITHSKPSVQRAARRVQQAVAHQNQAAVKQNQAAVNQSQSAMKQNQAAVNQQNSAPIVIPIAPSPAPISEPQQSVSDLIADRFPNHTLIDWMNEYVQTVSEAKEVISRMTCDEITKTAWANFHCLHLFTQDGIVNMPSYQIMQHLEIYKLMSVDKFKAWIKGVVKEYDSDNFFRVAFFIYNIIKDSYGKSDQVIMYEWLLKKYSKYFEVYDWHEDNFPHPSQVGYVDYGYIDYLTAILSFKLEESDDDDATISKIIENFFYNRDMTKHPTSKTLGCILERKLVETRFTEQARNKLARFLLLNNVQDAFSKVSFLIEEVKDEQRAVELFNLIPKDVKYRKITIRKLLAICPESSRLEIEKTMTPQEQKKYKLALHPQAKT